MCRLARDRGGDRFAYQTRFTGIETEHVNRERSVVHGPGPYGRVHILQLDDQILVAEANDVLIHTNRHSEGLVRDDVVDQLGCHTRDAAERLDDLQALLFGSRESAFVVKFEPALDRSHTTHHFLSVYLVGTAETPNPSPFIADE